MRSIAVAMAAVLCGVGLLVEASGCGSGVSYRPLVPTWPTDSEVQGQSVPSDDVLIVAELYDPEDALAVRLDLDRADGSPLDLEQITWIFGDGTTGSGCPALHTYARDGEYQVQARIVPAGSDTPYNVSLLIPLCQFAVEIETIPEVPQGRAPMTVQLEADVRLPWEQQVVRYRWELGDGRVVEDDDAFDHTYTAPGDYPIGLTVVTDTGWSRTATLQAFVASGYNQPPHAVADVDPAGGRAPLTVLLYGGDSFDSDGEVVAYHWRFGDGQSVANPLAEHVYAQEGDYIATLTVTDDEGGINTAEVLVSVEAPPAGVNHPPVAAIDADHTEGTAPLTVRFDASFSLDPDGDAIVDYQWDFDDGQFGSGQVLHHTYDGAGQYWPSLTVTDDKGAAGTSSASIRVEAAAAQMSVSPGGGLVSSGSQDGPFDPSSQTYIVENTGTATLSWAATEASEWVSLSATGGTLVAGASQAVVVSINGQAADLGPGSYEATVTFTNVSNGAGNTGRSVQLTVESPGALSVTPGDGLVAAGPEGGPFSPDRKTYTVGNPGTASIDWSVSTASDWLDLSRTGGTLSPGGSDTVVVSVNAQANSMPVGGYGASIQFVNVTSGSGDTTRAVSLWINSGSAQTMATANRTSGVAPLAVFFDAVDPASGVVQSPDGNHANVYYRWNFGDPDSGTWSTTGRSRNEATGYVAAHVYEQPGTYIVTLTVTESAGATYQYEQQIQVQPFGGTTYYVSSSSGSDGNDGRSASRPLRTLDAAIAQLGANRRILLKRGDTWRVASGIWIGGPGPGIIGAYANSDGSDDLSQTKPHIVITGGGSGITCSWVGASDWRIMDVRVSADGYTTSWGVDLGWDGAYRWLVLRVETDGFDVGIGCTSDGEEFAQNVVADCNIHDHVGINVYLAGQKTALLGNWITDAMESHVLRMWHAQKVVISDNVCHNPGLGRQALKLHGYDVGYGPPTEHVIVSDNSFRGSTYVVAIAPENAESNEPVQNVVFERNVVTGDNDTVAGVYLNASDITVRNNIFDAGGVTTWFIAVAVTDDSGRAPRRNVICNNTAYMGGWGNEFRLCTIGGMAENTTVRNNLASAPHTSDRQLIVGSGSGLVADHNLLTSVPGFVNAAAGDFRLGSGSPAIDAGLAVPQVFEDWLGHLRPRGATYDLGAYEY